MNTHTTFVRALNPRYGTAPAATPESMDPTSLDAVRQSGISHALKMISPEDLRQDRPLKGTGKATSFVTRLIRNETELETVYRLAHDAYLDYGYITPQPDGFFCAARHLDLSHHSEIWVVTKAGKIIATASLTMDGPEGLSMENEFVSELADVRAENSRLGCIWRLAVDREHRMVSRVVLQLVAHMVSRLLVKCDTGLFVVNPRHSGYYRRLLNMLTLASCATMHGLKDAPADLLRWDAARCPVRWKRPPNEADNGGIGNSPDKLDNESCD